MIQIITSSRYKLDRKTLKETAKKSLLKYGLGEEYQLNIVFVGRKKMKDLSKKYKQESVALPVLTFFFQERMNVQKPTAEVLICYPQAVLLAAQREKKVDDMLMQLLDHGIHNLRQF